MDIVAGILELIAKYMCGRKSYLGWVVHIAAGGLWLIVMAKTRVWGLGVIVLPGMVINLINWKRWHNGK